MAFPGIALYKLMILYMLDKVACPLSNSRITNFMLDAGYTDYFHAQEAISDLLGSGYIRAETSNGSTLYSITPEGENTIHYTENMMDPGIRSEITEYLKKNSFDLRSESGVRSDYSLTGNGEYAVRCSIIEQGEPLFEMTIHVMTKDEAEKICHDWEEKSQKLYMSVMETLLGDGEGT